MLVLIAGVGVSGCADIEPGRFCNAYVDCVRGFDTERGTTTNVDRFVDGGACWDGQKGADVCEMACKRGIPVLTRQEPTLDCEVPQ
jgi:hypothetical protein